MKHTKASNSVQDRSVRSKRQSVERPQSRRPASLSASCLPVQFSLRWYLCARKSPYAFHSVSQRFPQRCLWNGSNVRLIDDSPLSSFPITASSAFSFHHNVLHAIDGLISLPLCPQVVSQAPQHFRSSTTQATCEGCFARQSICSVISLHSGMSRAVHIHFSLTHSSLGLPFHFSLSFPPRAHRVHIKSRNNAVSRYT